MSENRYKIFEQAVIGLMVTLIGSAIVAALLGLYALADLVF